MSNQSLSREAVLAALSTVQEPELHRDLVSLNMVQDLQIQDGKVSFEVILTTPACPLKGIIERNARQAVMGIDGVEIGGCPFWIQCTFGWEAARRHEAAGKKCGRNSLRQRRCG